MNNRRRRKFSVFDRILAVSLSQRVGERVLIGLYIGLALVLMVASSLSKNWVHVTQTQLSDITSPIFSTLILPVRAVIDRGYEVSGLQNLATENAELRLQNQELLQWKDRALALMNENKALQALTRLDPLPRANYMTARIISDTGGMYSKTLTLDKGKEDGVKQGFAVMVPEGLIGIIIETGDVSSRALLIQDVNARVPVVSEDTRHAVMLAGTNTDKLSLKYLDETAEIKMGERLVTSGRGGLLVPGIPVAHMVQSSKDELYAKPLAHYKRADYVQVVDFGRQSGIEEF